MRWRFIKSVCVFVLRTHLHGEDCDIVPADLLSIQRTHRHQRPGSELDVEVLVEVAGRLDGVPGDTKQQHVRCEVSALSKRESLCVFFFEGDLVILSEGIGCTYTIQHVCLCVIRRQAASF